MKVRDTIKKGNETLKLENETLKSELTRTLLELDEYKSRELSATKTVKKKLVKLEKRIKKLEDNELLVDKKNVYKKRSRNGR